MLNECCPWFIISTSELLSVAQYLVYEYYGGSSYTSTAKTNTFDALQNWTNILFSLIMFSLYQEG